MTEFEIQDIGLLDPAPQDLPGWEIVRSHLDWLAKESNRHNLTRVPEDLWFQRHVVDSVAPYLAGWDIGNRFVDLGTGAGFPGIPLAVLRPLSRFHLVEKKKKTASLLNEFLRATGLAERGEALAVRAENLGRDPGFREQYNKVATRALANLSCLIELGVPFLEPEGELWCWKSDLEEIGTSEKALAELNAKVTRVLKYVIPGEFKARYILAVGRVGDLPDRYPRREGVPQRKPLG